MAPSLAPLIDRPAREALSRGQAGLFPLLAPGLSGLALVSLTTLTGLALGGRLALFEPMLRALVEALLLATPVLLVVTTFALPKLSPSTTLSALSISMAVAGLSSALVLPMLAFLWLCADSSPGAWGAFAAAASSLQLLVAPAVFLVGVSVMLSRTLSAFSHWGGERIAWLFGLLTFSVFLMRIAPHFSRG